MRRKRRNQQTPKRRTRPGRAGRRSARSGLASAENADGTGSVGGGSGHKGGHGHGHRLDARSGGEDRSERRRILSRALLADAGGREERERRPQDEAGARRVVGPRWTPVAPSPAPRSTPCALPPKRLERRRPGRRPGGRVGAHGGQRKGDSATATIAARESHSATAARARLGSFGSAFSSFSPSFPPPLSLFLSPWGLRSGHLPFVPFGPSEAPFWKGSRREGERAKAESPRAEASPPSRLCSPGTPRSPSFSSLRPLRSLWRVRPTNPAPLSFFFRSDAGGQAARVVV